MDAERARQQALMAALWQPVGSDAAAAAEAALRPWLCADGPDPARGLLAYRSHARALAPRVLQAAYPTVAALVGDEAWSALARRHWLLHPPVRGDLAQWGASLPAALADDPRLADCPYLADVARLDWAVHLASSATDAPAGVAGLTRLGGPDAADCRLRGAPGAALVDSPWPIVALWQAHAPLPPPSDSVPSAPRPEDAGGHALAPAEPDLRAAQALLAQGLGQRAWVWRPGGQWRVQVAALGPGDAACLQAVLDGLSVGQAIDAALAADRNSDSGADTDHHADAALPWSFEAWLVQALQQGWLAAVLPPADPASSR